VGALRTGLADFRQAFTLRGLWWALAREDIVDSFRRTLLGPLWIALSYVLFVAAIYIAIGPTDPSFLTYLAVGLLVWNFISDCIGAAPMLFVREAAFVQGTTLPFSLYVFRLVGRSTIRMVYALVPLAAILYHQGVVDPVGIGLALAGLATLVLIMPALVLIVAILGVYFRDLEQIVPNVLRVLFFLSPIMWLPEQLGWRYKLYLYNPVTYLIDMCRAPLLDLPFDIVSWEITLALSAGLWLLAVLLLGATRRRIVFLV
jgi:ABC-type polysaccharide/polyol phosphate export permease